MLWVMSYVQLLYHSFVQYNVVSCSPLNNLNNKMWDPFLWDVTLHHWVISYKHFEGMQHLHLQGSWTLHTWKCMLHVSSKCSQNVGNQFTQWCIIISQENGILNYTTVKTSKLAATIQEYESTIHGDSWLMDITAGDDFLGLWPKSSYKHVSNFRWLWSHGHLKIRIDSKDYWKQMEQNNKRA